MKIWCFQVGLLSLSITNFAMIYVGIVQHGTQCFADVW